MSEWRAFRWREIREAQAWAAAGGVAVHLNTAQFRFHGMDTAHLLAQDEPHLIAAAASLGCDPRYIQRTRLVHFDLFGPRLTEALRRCAAGEAPGGDGAHSAA